MTRQMTPKLFVSLMNRSTKKSAEGFLAGYREWLTTGELAEKMSPIIAQIDNKSVSHENGLIAIRNVAFSHVMTEEIAKADARISSGGEEKKSDKPITAVVLTEAGDVAVVGDKTLRANFDHPQEAARWSWNRLNDGEVGWTAKITYNKVMVKGLPWEEVITRAQAIYALRKITKTPYMHRNRTSGALKQKMKVSGKAASFSHG